MRFNGDFNLLPFAASVRFGAIPSHPTSTQFQNAACMVAGEDGEYPEAHWHLEAIRERRLNPGCALDEAYPRIARRVAKRLYEIARIDGEG